MTASSIETDAHSRGPRVIALEWNAPQLYGALGELVRNGWELVYCVGYGMRDRITSDFPGAIYQDTHDARYGIRPKELVDVKPSVIDQPTTEALSFAELTCLKQMDRMELMAGFSLHDRLIHFHRLFGYWSTVFDVLHPDVLLMPTSPHVTYDYIAYTLARLRGIPIVLFEYVTLAGMLIAINGYENGVPQIMERYRKLRLGNPAGPIVLSKRMEEHWRTLRGSYDKARPPGLLQVLAHAEDFEKRRGEQEKHNTEELLRLESYKAREGKGFLGRLRLDLADAASRHTLGWLSPVAVAEALRTAREPLRAPTIDLVPPPPADGHYKGEFRYRWPEDVARLAELQRSAHITAMREHYDRYAVRADLSQPFIYVPLHLQPERATNPNGWVFDEQNVMIALIASTIPCGWRIYVKEHPAHFLSYATDRGRHITFYEAISNIPEVVMVSRDTSSFDLIDNCQAVATVTGTASWEALVRGVPTLVFGEAWYKGCEGAYSVRSADDCFRALQRIAAGERPSEQDVRLFLHAAEQVAFVGFLSGDDEEVAGTDQLTNARRLGEAIRQCYEDSRRRNRLDAVTL